mmetsp:Transcript_57502/g.64212  ORF Transcript_57502/g.64212 Transcript_57502/m.64212 type:complete len:89 (+) Transcript_57502:357-623(+)
MWITANKSGIINKYDIYYDKSIGEWIVLNKCSLRDDLIELLKKQYNYNEGKKIKTRVVPKYFLLLLWIIWKGEYEVVCGWKCMENRVF